MRYYCTCRKFFTWPLNARGPTISPSMAHNTQYELRQVFTHLARESEGVDGQQFARISKQLVQYLSKEYGISPLDMTTIDLIFAKVKPIGLRRIGFVLFVEAIEAVGRKMSIPSDRTFAALISVHSSRLDDGLKTPKPSLPGPSRFFYDKHTYTGVQARRQESPKPQPSNRPIELSEHVNRERRDTNLPRRVHSRRIPKQDDVSPASTIRRAPSRHAPLVDMNDPPAETVVSNEFYKKVVSEVFLNPVDKYFEGFLLVRD
jgi:hypothetical protein